jgi:hypothetical protein
MPKRKNHKLSLVVILAVFMFLWANFIFALEVNYPRVPGAAAPQDFINSAPQEEILSLYAKYLVNLAMWVTGIIAFLLLIYAGLLYALSAGSPEKILNAKNQVVSVFFGVLILLTSFLILRSINPQLLVFEIPGIEKITVALKPQLPEAAPVEGYRTSINTEVSFGTIIEKMIFETVSLDENEEPRMDRIKENAKTTLEIAEKIKEQSEDLKKESEKCTCVNSDPKGQPQPCCWLENPGEGCIDNQCRDKPGCTCDPCYKVRDKINEYQKKNLDEIEKLKEEQNKSKEEIRLIREEIGKLERVEKFMLECQLWPLDSLAEFLHNKDFFESNGWHLNGIKFWNDVSILIDAKKNELEWSTFYCPVSGSIWGEYPPSGVNLGGEKLIFDEEEVQDKMSCTEVKIGEIIDRSKRTAYKLVERLEKLINLGQQMINEVNQLHVFVSQCSSQRCFSFCRCAVCEDDACCDCIKSCGDNPQYPEGACPKADIQKQFDKINDILEGVPEGQGDDVKDEEGIKDVVEGPKKQDSEEDEEAREQIGIITIIDEIVPKIIEDLAGPVRASMKTCLADVPNEETGEHDQPQVVLSDCISTIGSLGDGGEIRKCCLGEQSYNDCLIQCYLETGEAYKNCLGGCINQKGGETADCHHQINFFCCGQ